MTYFVKNYNQPGSPPGLLDAEAGEYRWRIKRYSAERYEVLEGEAGRDYLRSRPQGEKIWLDIEGKPAPEFLNFLAKVLGLHPLALEDVQHQGQRAKLEDYENHLFLVLQRPRWVERQLSIVQVSMFLGDDFVISLDEVGGEFFAPVTRRLETSPRGRIRSSGVDYLFYALIDLVVDQAFPVLEGYAQELEELELEVIRNPKQRSLIDRIHETRRELVFLRRALWPQREVAAALLREEHGLIGKGTRLYLRDCADHAAQALDLADSYRDMSAAVLELLLATLNTQMNDVMRVLTMIATIFIPLSFVTGIYGMNFDTASPFNMPELGWAFGYPLVLAVIVAVAAGMVVYFKRKGWF